MATLMATIVRPVLFLRVFPDSRNAADLVDLNQIATAPVAVLQRQKLLPPTQKNRELGIIASSPQYLSSKLIVYPVL